MQISKEICISSAVNFRLHLVVESLASLKCGYYSKEDTPVPIPNTEVKLLSAESTWWEAAWEVRT